MSKRPAPSTDDIIVEETCKKIKSNAGLNGTDHPEGSWVCASCGNVNWPKRTRCNRQGCNMPRDQAEVGTPTATHPEGAWACVLCENINWPKRQNCNKPNCRAPRQGNPAQMGMGMMPGMGQAMGGKSDAGSHPVGSWSCLSCGNINWPRRTTCNNKQCGLPKPANVAGFPGDALNALGLGAQDPMMAYYAQQAAAAGGAPLQNLDPYAMLTGMGAAGMGGMGGMGAPGMGGAGMGGAGMAPQGSRHPPGSWLCPTCNNVNWPKRTVCNKANCGTARPGSVGAGAPAPQSQQHPEGSWSCITCGNINWPKRTVCNKAGCATPRPDNV